MWATWVSLAAFGEQQQVAWGELLRAEAAEAYAEALLLQVEGAVEQQPEFQGAAEQAAQQLQVAYLGQALPASGLQPLPVCCSGRRGQLFQGGEVCAVVGEVFRQPGSRQGGRGQVLVDTAQVALQQAEGQAPGHGAIALAAHTGAGGDGFAERQGQVIQRESQGRSLGGSGERLVVGTGDAVVTAGCYGQLAAAGRAGELHQAYMQVAAGM